MSKIEIDFRSGWGMNNKINIDDVNLSNLVSDVSLNFSPGSLVLGRFEVFLTSAKITTEGIVEINGVPVSDDIGREIYKSLKEKYEK